MSNPIRVLVDPNTAPDLVLRDWANIYIHGSPTYRYCQNGECRYSWCEKARLQPAPYCPNCGSSVYNESEEERRERMPHG